jgi:SMI1 / KNR4 family (SUKH-1)
MSLESLLEIEEGSAASPASEEGIADAERRIGRRLPEELRAFLRRANGWTGRLNGWDFLVHGTEELVAANDEAFNLSFPGYLAWGSNGGLETYAAHFDASGALDQVVALDRNSSSPDDVWPIAPTIASAIQRLEVQPLGPWQRSENAQIEPPG